MSEFQEFAKIPRLSRECVITEKIDGTNAQVYIVEWAGHGCPPEGEPLVKVGDLWLWAGSRSRWLQPGKADNFGFAAWVLAHAEALAGLGAGRHFGEWWGSGVQRGYGLTDGEKRFSLFNVARWHAVGAEPFATLSGDPRQPQKLSTDAPACCHVVPVLHRGEFDTSFINGALHLLAAAGSKAAPGFKNPEGVVVFHRASGTLFKKTLEKDAEPKVLLVRR